MEDYSSDLRKMGGLLNYRLNCGNCKYLAKFKKNFRLYDPDQYHLNLPRYFYRYELCEYCGESTKIEYLTIFGLDSGATFGNYGKKCLEGFDASEFYVDEIIEENENEPQTIRIKRKLDVVSKMENVDGRETERNNCSKVKNKTEIWSNYDTIDKIESKKTGYNLKIQNNLCDVTSTCEDKLNIPHKQSIAFEGSVEIEISEADGNIMDNIFEKFEICNDSPFKNTDIIKSEKLISESQNCNDYLFHKQTTNEEIRFSCEVCIYKTKHEEYLKWHMESCHEDSFYTCKQCNFKTKFEYDLMTHTDSVHVDLQIKFDSPNLNNIKNNIDSFEKEYESEYIKSNRVDPKDKDLENSSVIIKTFFNENNLEDHVEYDDELIQIKFEDVLMTSASHSLNFSWNKNKSIKKEILNTITYENKKTYDEFNFINKVIHDTYKKSTKNGKPCFVCSKSFLSETSLKTHIKVAHEFACVECDYYFQCISDLVGHMNTVHMEVIYSCDLCNYCSKQKEYNEIHITTMLSSPVFISWNKKFGIS